MSHNNNDYKSAFGTVRIPPHNQDGVADTLIGLKVLEKMGNGRIRFTEQFKGQRVKILNTVIVDEK